MAQIVTEREQVDTTGSIDRTEAAGAEVSSSEIERLLRDVDIDRSTETSEGVVGRMPVRRALPWRAWSWTSEHLQAARRRFRPRATSPEFQGMSPDDARNEIQSSLICLRCI